jgi:peptidoglycan/LPS O-acetylase OafA/YrhL
MLLFIFVSILNHPKIHRWGRPILLLIVVGTAISGIAAVRDAYMMENALFATEGMQSMICSVAGGLIFLTGLIAIFIRNQKYRKAGYFFIVTLFLIQVVTIEGSRIMLL